MGQMFVNIPAPWSIWDNFYVFASILQQTLLWFPRKHVEHFQNPWVAKHVLLNVVSWLVARFAIVPKNIQLIQGPSNVWKVHYCGNNFWQTVFLNKKWLSEKTCICFWKKICFSAFPKRIRWLVKPLLKTSFSTNFQGTGPWEGPIHFSRFVLRGTIAANFSRADPGAKRRKKSLLQKQPFLSLSLFLSLSPVRSLSLSLFLSLSLALPLPFPLSLSLSLSLVPFLFSFSFSFSYCCMFH